MSEMHSVKECFRVGKVKIISNKGDDMEWIVGSVIFLILAKKGLRKQGKEVQLKDSLSTIAANVTLEVAELCEVEIVDLNSTKGKRP